MTLFLIILTIFLVVQLNTKMTLAAQSKEHYRKNKSNAKLQYDTACEIIEKMAKVYREGICLLPIKDFLLDCYGKLENSNYFNEKHTLKNEDFLEYAVIYQERMWVVATARACNLPINKKTLSLLYNNIWDKIPNIYSESFLREWILQYNLSEDDKHIATYLKASIILKQHILHDEQKGNSYVAYNNSRALDYVAQKFNLPLCQEKLLLDNSPYNSLQDLCFLYMARHAKKEQYKHIPLTMICPNPTEKQKEIQYAKLSYEENIDKRAQQRFDITKNYDL